MIGEPFGFRLVSVLRLGSSAAFCLLRLSIFKVFEAPPGIDATHDLVLRPYGICNGKASRFGTDCTQKALLKDRIHKRHIHHEDFGKGRRFTILCRMDEGLYGFFGGRAGKVIIAFSHEGNEGINRLFHFFGWQVGRGQSAGGRHIVWHIYIWAYIPICVNFYKYKT